jgi:glutamate synthase (NADPH/NADH) large chain
VVNYFFFVAEEVRQLMAKLGVRNYNELIGQSDRLNMRKAIKHWKAKGLDYSNVLYKPQAEDGVAIYCQEAQDHGLDKALDHELIKQAQPALENSERVTINLDVQNFNRSFGTMLSGRIAEKYGHQGLAEDTITINAKGTVGQSFGAWVAKGVTIKLAGEGNDYVGKGLSGGKLIIHPPADSALAKAEENIIVGNTVLYGAIAGQAYFNGVAGERFAVRNSGATAIVEGVGDHGCEYMTGGIVVCLGETGRNFAAGMSGGIAYVLDKKASFARRCNMEMVKLEAIKPDSNNADVTDMTTADEMRLKSLIQQHLDYTGSAVAKTILDDWEAHLGYFVKVMPTDYYNALINAKQKQAAG